MGIPFGETIHSPVDSERDMALAEDLRKPVEQYFERHMDARRDWLIDDIVPYELGRNYKDQPWSPEDYPMPDGVRDALLVNLLTEDNLPWYTHLIAGLTNESHPLHDWARRWTAEEDSHSNAMRLWLGPTRALDPVLLEDSRMQQVEGAEVPRMKTVSEMLAYTSFQELATGVAHRNAGKELKRIDQLDGTLRHGGTVMARLAGDEGHHHKFYRDVAKAGLEIDPSTMILAISHQLRKFKMPGTGIPNFSQYEKTIAESGIYDVVAFRDQVVKPTLGHWAIDAIPEEKLSSEAQKARTAIHRRIAVLDRI